jgi:competence protein ComEA
MKEYIKNIMNLIKCNKWILITIVTIVLLLSFGYTANKSNTVIKLKGNNENKITVYLKGAVKNEGTYYIEKDSTLENLLNISGGISQQADISNIQLSKKLQNGDIITINKKERYEEVIDTEEDDKSDKIDINSATKEELMELDGIGEKTAEKIIEYRKKTKFKDIEEIKEVKGIGEKKYEKIKNYICI